MALMVPTVAMASKTTAPPMAMASMTFPVAMMLRVLSVVIVARALLLQGGEGTAYDDSNKGALVTRGARCYSSCGSKGIFARGERAIRTLMNKFFLFFVV